MKELAFSYLVQRNMNIRLIFIIVYRDLTVGLT